MVQTLRRLIVPYVGTQLIPNTTASVSLQCFGRSNTSTLGNALPNGYLDNQASGLIKGIFAHIVPGADTSSNETAVYGGAAAATPPTGLIAALQKRDAEYLAHNLDAELSIAGTLLGRYTLSTLGELAPMQPFANHVGTVAAGDNAVTYMGRVQAHRPWVDHEIGSMEEISVRLANRFGRTAALANRNYLCIVHITLLIETISRHGI